MPWASSVAGSSLNLMLLRWATSVSALLTISSEILRPRRWARCICSSCSTRRSTTCCRRTLRGGNCWPDCWMRAPITDICFSTSLRSTRPSLTTAATRSSRTPDELRSLDWPWTVPTAASNRTAAPKNCLYFKGISGSGRGGKRGVSPNRFAQESFVVHSDTGQTLQFQLQANRRFGIARAAGDEAPCDYPHGPAAGRVFEAQELVQRLVFLQ